jgi:hypothetical protein
LFRGGHGPVRVSRRGQLRPTCARARARPGSLAAGSATARPGRERPPPRPRARRSRGFGVEGSGRTQASSGCMNTPHPSARGLLQADVLAPPSATARWAGAGSGARAA